MNELIIGLAVAAGGAAIFAAGLITGVLLARRRDGSG